MPKPSVTHLLEQLEQSKDRYGRGEASRAEKLLDALTRRRFADAESLIRFHEALLFLRAFPQGPGVVARTERILNDFYQRVADLRTQGADMSPFDVYEVLGIAGTAMEDTLNFDTVRWLARHIPRNVEIVWDGYDEDRALAATWLRFMPLVEEDGDVEANIPWRRWLDAARGRERELEWLVRRFEQLPCSPREKVEIYGSLRLPVRWRIENLALSRTRNRWPARSFYYHHEPLITRKQVSLERELARPAPKETLIKSGRSKSRFLDCAESPVNGQFCCARNDKVGVNQSFPALKKVPLAEGRRVIDKIQEVMLVRYRELYGTTLGDPRSVVRADVDRGTVIYLWGLPPERRLPIRAYLAGFTVKNGVPINYIEAIGLCEWIEIGFNTFYTFRGGETAWIYAQVLRLLNHYMGAECISVYPYQIGDGNEEAIESGAFWFYRKLGFRPGREDLLRLCEREEQQIATKPGYKTPSRTLRQLAKAHAFYELPKAERGAWDRFSTRNIGLRVNRVIAREYSADIVRMRCTTTEKVARALGVSISKWTNLEKQAFENWALVFSLIPDLARWTAREKANVLRIIHAKAAGDEMRYLRLTQRHGRLRGELLRLGS